MLGIRQAIGVRLKEARESKGLTLGEVAERLNVRRQSVSAWEVGKTMPESDNWYKLSELYEASLDYLVKGRRMIPVSDYAYEKWRRRPKVLVPSADPEDSCTP